MTARSTTGPRRWLAEQIESSSYVELAGDRPFPLGRRGRRRRMDEIEEFLTGVRPGARAGAGPRHGPLHRHRRLDQARATELGDRRWRELLEDHQALVRERLGRFDGREIKTTGDGFLATFDGPTRAVECARRDRRRHARLGIEIRAGLHTGEVELIGDESAASPSTSPRGSRHSPARAKCSPRGRCATSPSARESTSTRRACHGLKGVADEWEVFSVEATPLSAGSTG